jgi:hypothetical protein
MLKMRDWKLLVSPDQFGEGAKSWFISFYKELGLNEQKLEEMFNIPNFTFDTFAKSIDKYIDLHPDMESMAFAFSFWSKSQAALDEYYRVRSHPLFRLQSKLHYVGNWLISWKNYFRFHSQDLRKEEGVWLYKRCWFTLYRERSEENRTTPLMDLRFEIISRSRLGLGIRVVVGGEDQIQLGIRAWKLGSCWFTIEQMFPCHWFPAEERVTGISLYEDHLSLSLWRDDLGGSQSGGFYKGVFLMDLLFGSADYVRSPTMQKKIEIYLPEATYQGTAEAYVATWTRPRAWWWKKQVHRVELQFPDGIPIPGKGENVHDLDEDATYSSNRTADTIEEAAQAFIEDILKTRRERGGAEWLPERGVRA